MLKDIIKNNFYKEKRKKIKDNEDKGTKINFTFKDDISIEVKKQGEKVENF